MAKDYLDKKTIMIINRQTFPVPSVAGGAVQQLVTNLLDVNEKYKSARFIVTSVYDKKASIVKYSDSKIYYFKNGILANYKVLFWAFRWIIFRLVNRISVKGKANKTKEPTGFFVFQHCCIAKKEKVDIVLLENVDKSAKYAPLKMIVGDDNIYNHLHFVRTADMSERYAIPNSISSGMFGKNEWIRENPDFGKNFVLYDGININDFSEPLINRSIERKNLGFQNQDIVVLFCGRFIQIKGVSQLLDAFDKIKNKNNIKLLLIGSAQYSKNTVTEFSKEIIERATRMENVVLLGYIPNEEMPKYYAASDILAVPSTCHEAAGLVAIEGMAAGLPLIITQSGSMVEYVTDECAIKLPIDSELSNNLANSIVELSNNPDLRAEMSKASRDRAKSFSSEIFYENFLKTLDK